MLALATGCGSEPEPAPAPAPTGTAPAEPVAAEPDGPPAPATVSPARRGLDVGMDMFELLSKQVDGPDMWVWSAGEMRDRIEAVYGVRLEGTPALPTELPEYYCQALDRHDALASNYVRLGFHACQWLDARPPMMQQQIRSRILEVARALEPQRADRVRTVRSVLDGSGDLRKHLEFPVLLDRIAALYAPAEAP
jgi:hypothetical protein